MAKKTQLETLRGSIREVDNQLLNLMAQRIELAKRVGQFKLENKLPIKDFGVESEVIKSNRARASEIGLYEDMAEEAAKLLIHYAVLTQEEFHKLAHKKTATVSAKKIAIIGGNGKMGRWLGQFFSSANHKVTLIDSSFKEPGAIGETYLTNKIFPIVHTADFIILSTPISKTANLIEQLAKEKVKGLVFDICSLKTPLLPAIKKAEKSGLKISSAHPMFGPQVKLLAGRNIILCAAKNKAIIPQVADLFKNTTANIVQIPIEKHDELMSYVLGLSHIVNLSFAKVLCESPYSFKELKTVASSTFFSQLDVVSPVVAENKDLYYEIQAENRFTGKIIRQLIKTLAAYLKSIEKKERGSFVAYMEKSRKYIHG